MFENNSIKLKDGDHNLRREILKEMGLNPDKALDEGAKKQLESAIEEQFVKRLNNIFKRGLATLQVDKQQKIDEGKKLGWWSEVKNRFNKK